jgi:hypothetical protein
MVPLCTINLVLCIYPPPLIKILSQIFSLGYEYIPFIYNYLALLKIFFTILRISVLISKRNLKKKIGLKENSLLQEGCLLFRALWITVFLSPRKTHAIFLRDTYNVAENIQYDD